MQQLSLEKRVTKDSVPAFIWSTFEDDAVPCENSLQMALAYKKTGVPMELHVFEKGWHGLSLANSEVNAPQPATSKWVWLENRGFVVK